MDAVAEMDLQFSSDDESHAAGPGGDDGTRRGSKGLKRLAQAVKALIQEEAQQIQLSARQVNEVIDRSKARVRRAMKRVATATKRSRADVTHKVRRLVTGDEHKRVRDMVRTELAKPIHVKLIDKLSFTFGVLGLLFTEFMLIQFPQHLWRWYCACVFPLMLLRWIIYKKNKWHYFMLDYCYFTNLACLVYIYLLPAGWLFQLVFAASNGPLLWAIVAWNNSLVFHSLDKITSVFIHGLPAMLTYTLRWHTPKEKWDTICVRSDCSLSVLESIGASVAMYVFWQTMYWLQTEVVDRAKLSKDHTIQTSLRWFTSHSSPLAKGVLSMLRKVGVFGRSEKFDGNNLKTKLTFVGSQFVYTLLTLLPTAWTFTSRTTHNVVGLFVLVFCIWSGACYYIEVFSTRYIQRFEEAVRKQRERADKYKLQAETQAAAAAASAAAGAGASGDGALGAGAGAGAVAGVTTSSSTKGSRSMSVSSVSSSDSALSGNSALDASKIHGLASELVSEVQEAAAARAAIVAEQEQEQEQQEQHDHHD